MDNIDGELETTGFKILLATAVCLSVAAAAQISPIYYVRLSNECQAGRALIYDFSAVSIRGSNRSGAAK